MSDLATQGGDDLRASLESAFTASTDTHATTAPAVAATPAVADIPGETQEQKAERVRDEAGRFAKAQEKTAGADKTVDPNAPPAAPSPLEKPARKLPNSWKREIAAVWTKADAGQPLTAEEIDLLRDEAIRREGDFHTGIQQYKTGAEAAAKFEQAYKPYEATIRQLGVTPDVAAAHLFGVDHKLRHSNPQAKATMVADLIQSYGIDPNEVFKNFLPKQEVDPNLKPIHDEIAALRQQNAELQQRWQTQTQSSQEREMATLNSEIAKFRQGKEHFEAVSGDMAALLPLVRQSQPDASHQEVLQDAYDRAIWARPDLRAGLLEQQRIAAEAKARTQMQNQRAQSAAVSVKGSSPVSGGAAAPNNTVREALESAMNGQS
jgi:hypothetical protein